MAPFLVPSSTASSPLPYRPLYSVVCARGVVFVSTTCTGNPPLLTEFGRRSIIPFPRPIALIYVPLDFTGACEEVEVVIHNNGGLFCVVIEYIGTGYVWEVPAVSCR